MANKPVAKYSIDKVMFMEMLKRRNLTLRGLERKAGFHYSTKSVARALKSGYMSYGLAESLANAFEMPTSSFINSVITVEKVSFPTYDPRLKIDHNYKRAIHKGE